MPPPWPRRCKNLIADDGLSRAVCATPGLARAREFTFEKLTAERMTAIRRLIGVGPKV